MQRLRNLLLMTTALLAAGLAPALAGPDGATVVGGSVSVQNPGTANVTVNQFSQNAIVNWHTFDIGVGQRTQFVQPNSTSVILNRVTGGLGPSQILGTLDANGKVFVVNRDGIIFGAGAVINTAGFLATTSDIKNDDFMAGRFNFGIPGRPDASIVNMGTITAANGGFAALVAPGVRNSGTITARLGTVALGAGNIFTLDFYGDRLITLGVGDAIANDVKDVATGQTLKSLVTNDGKLKANGGRVELTAAAARQVVDSVINTSGVIEANSVGMRNGQIVLSAATAGTKGDAPAQRVRVSGKLSAAGKKAGTKGGTIVVTGEDIQIAGATINASGRDGGGKVLIGGDWGGGKPDTSLVSNQSARLEGTAIPNATTVSVDAATRIDASAKDRGDGGKVVLWSDGHTSFAGTILALGGREFGSGGFIETSGKTVDIGGSINAGQGGAWLLDPVSLIVDTTLAATIQSSLNGGTSVTQQTGTSGGGDGDIILNSGVRIAWNTSATLTLVAFRNIQFNDGALGAPNGNLVNTGAGHLVLRADSTGTGIGTILMPNITNATRVNWSASTGNVKLYYNPTVFGTQDSFTAFNQVVFASSSQLTQYMLVNTATNLQNISTNLGGTYALGRDIDTSGIPNFAPIGNISTRFTGVLDGLGQTISNLTIAPTSGITNVGMFGAIGATGVVRNLNITNATVTANPNAPPPGQFIGVLAGSNAGTISNVSVSGTVSNGTVQNGVIAGGLVGQNGIFGPGAAFGTITNAHAAVNVTVGNSTTGSQNNNAGGLVGDNPGTITNSDASGNVTGGTNSFIGGLVGRNDAGATIVSSSATGNVNLTNSRGSGAGGLVGFNFGSINLSNASSLVTGSASSDIFQAGALGGLVGLNDAAGTITNSFATGGVVGGSNTSTGGLVGFNNGTVAGSHATGAVFSLDNFAGGLTGFNQFGATITNSYATGNVTGGGFETGGLVGENHGTITNSHATGNVIALGLTNGSAGGFVGDNTGYIFNSYATGTVVGLNNAGGFAGSNGGWIDASYAFGAVATGNGGTAGGFVDVNHGVITNSHASGAVTGGGDVVLGGFAAGNFGVILSSSASGTVISTGANGIVGGFAGLNADTIVDSHASGAVIGTSESYLGGFVGINAGWVQDSTSTGNVTGIGSHNFAGGFAGMNFGFIDPSFSSGNVTSGANSTVGGFVGANGALEFPGGYQVIGTIAPDSFGTGSASGGSGSTVGSQVGQDYPVAGLPVLPTAPCSGNGGGLLCEGQLFNPNQFDNTSLSPQLVVAANLVSDTTGPKTDGDVIPNTTQTANPPSGPSGGQPGGNANGGRPAVNQVPPPGLGPLPSGMPPLNETRFASNEVVMQLGGAMTPDAIAALARSLGLEVITQQNFGVLGRTVYRFRIAGNLSVRDVIKALEANRVNVSAQPSYVFTLTQDVAQAGGAPDLAGAPADTSRKGDSAQYIVGKLNLAAAHVIATGNNVKVAVIDSEIDANHPDLQGVITATYDALPSTDQTPHPHGTGMAGAIASHKRLLGVAPGAKLLAVRAFGVDSNGAQGTSMNIVKGLQWAVDQGAKVINMSFAGPRDPILQQAIKKLTDDGIILIAAAGNAGPKSPPLFPGADANVIAVSATDVDDKVYKNANRGKYVAIASPGVDILVPAPDGGYQLTTGTSVAAAHISGVVALLLERNAQLKPAEMRSILTTTAKNIGPNKNDVGAGLVDPVQALAKAGLIRSAQVR